MTYLVSRNRNETQHWVSTTPTHPPFCSFVHATHWPRGSSVLNCSSQRGRWPCPSQRQCPGFLIKGFIIQLVLGMHHVQVQWYARGIITEVPRFCKHCIYFSKQGFQGIKASFEKIPGHQWRCNILSILKLKPLCAEWWRGYRKLLYHLF